MKRQEVGERGKKEKEGRERETETERREIEP